MPVNVHQLQPTNKLTTQKTNKKGHELMVEFHFRRKWLAASLLVIGAVLVGLFFKIREVDRRQGPG